MQKWKRAVFLDHRASLLFRNYCLAVRASTSTSPPAPARMPPPTQLQRRVEPEAITKLQGIHSSDCLRTRRSTYIVNPSRYPPSWLTAGPSVNDHSPLSPKQQCSSSLPTLTVQYSKIPLQIDHLSPHPDPSLSHKKAICNVAMLMLEPHAIRLTRPPPHLMDNISLFSSTSSPSTTPHHPRDNKPTPAQLSFVLLKLREEVC